MTATITSYLTKVVKAIIILYIKFEQNWFINVSSRKLKNVEGEIQNLFIFQHPLYFMSLKEYFKKRDVKKSGEPSEKKSIAYSKKHIYVIHEHHASHLHWDLRLQMRGVLKSWAVPKQPPRAKNVKRLAIQVEDHPMSYANFEGEIKDGYGKGTVKIWDKGELKILEADKDKIEFELKGKKLLGKYVLIHAKMEGNEKNWLFFKV